MIISAENYTIIVWVFIVICYIGFTSQWYMYIRGNADKYGRKWKELYPCRVARISFNMKFYGALIIVFTSLLLL